MGLFDGLFGSSGSSSPSAPAAASSAPNNPQAADVSFLKKLTGIMGAPQMRIGFGYPNASVVAQTDPNQAMIKALIEKMAGPQKPETVSDNPTHESPVYRYSPSTMGISPADMLNRSGGSPFGFGNAFSNPFGRGPATIGAP